jgi:hypothetical protein
MIRAILTAVMAVMAAARLAAARLAGISIGAAVLAAVPVAGLSMGASSVEAAPPGAPVVAPPAAAGYSAASLYNLANAYARAGKPGFAVLNYERARLLDPTDPDMQANLRHVRDSAGLPPEPLSLVDRWAGRVNPADLAWAGLMGGCVGGACVLAGRRYSRHRRKLFFAAAVGILLLGVSIARGVMLWPVMHESVVISHSAPVRVSPVIIGDPLFELPEASMVSTSAEHDGFVLIRTAAGRTGWVPGTNLAPLVPKR